MVTTARPMKHFFDQNTKKLDIVYPGLTWTKACTPAAGSNRTMKSSNICILMQHCPVACYQTLQRAKIGTLHNSTSSNDDDGKWKVTLTTQPRHHCHYGVSLASDQFSSHQQPRRKRMIEPGHDCLGDLGRSWYIESRSCHKFPRFGPTN